MLLYRISQHCPPLFAIKSNVWSSAIFHCGGERVVAPQAALSVRMMEKVTDHYLVCWPVLFYEIEPRRDAFAECDWLLL